MKRMAALLMSGVLWAAGTVIADEAPIAGTVKAVDPAGQTLVIETTVRGKTRQVTIGIKPESRIVRFARSPEPGSTGFVEQALGLADIKPGWIVSVTTKHDGGREVAEVVKVVLER